MADGCGCSKEYFNRVASEWERMREGYYDESVIKAALGKVELGKGDLVADIGAGTGFVSVAVAPLVGKVYAIDQSPGMLEILRRKMEELGLDNIECLEAEMGGLPLPDRTLDVVFANMALHHATDPVRAVGEMVRVLKAGGTLVITDLDEHTHNWLREEMNDVWLGFKRELIREWFSSEGLTGVSVDCVGSDCSAESTCGDKAAVSIFVASGRKTS